jgi:hypothetical protein
MNLNIKDKDSNAMDFIERAKGKKTDMSTPPIAFLSNYVFRREK